MVVFSFFEDGKPLYAVTHSLVFASSIQEATDTAIINSVNYYFTNYGRQYDPGKHTSVMVTQQEDILPNIPCLT